ncbi:mitochondrial carrier [Lojkania enalia]|uniref:Mitochondrial carrier n=1 Tax=Lojkania enalia TaxID=147567 RepID=A0A9P4KCP1_9PLEO|nr:mitochondrial carrier [Didymosphaeria enalia]
MAAPVISHTGEVPQKIVKGKSKEPVWLGGAAASMAACFTHPLDQTKYRMQVRPYRVSLVRAVHAFAVRDGIPSLWNGLSGSILRQSTYSTTRFALYELFSNKLLSIAPSNNGRLSSQGTVVCAGLAGGVAGLVGNPAEIVLVRMCADGARPSSERYNYRNLVDAFIRIRREDGLGAYFRGLGPNIVRSILMNVSQIATYAETKKLLTRRFGFGDDIKTHVYASLVAGTVATTMCAPADVLKSRLQNASGVTGNEVSILRYIFETSKKEGPDFLMRGWTPAWLRLAPSTVLTFVFMEKLKSLFV